MNTTTPKRSLRSLEKQLQQSLDAQLWGDFPIQVPIQVRCAIENADLLVLAQHRSGARPDLQQTFKAIHQAILSLSPELGGELRLYLRVFGQLHPYAYHAFKLPQPLGSVDCSGDRTNPLAAWAWLEKLIEEHGETARPGSEPAVEDREASDRPLTPDNCLALTVQDEAIEGGELSTITGIEEFSDSLFDRPDSAKDVRMQTVKFTELPSWWGQVSAYLFVSVAICSVGLYAFTRPCVVGKCEIIAQAEQSIDRGQQTLSEAKYAQHLEQAQEQFSLATEQLKQIPVWSTKQLPARRLLNSYQGEAKYIDQAIASMETGATAWKKARNAPLPLEVWREIESSWSEACALLENIPPQSQLYPFAQKKLSEYEGNFQAIARRVKREENAAETLLQIRAKADLAYTRQGVASSVASWQGVYQLWQDTLNQTAKIPPETMAYVQFQDLLGDYRTQLALARERLLQEKVAQDIYDRAIAAAEQAEQLSQEKQWSLSLNRWTDALTSARQVPDNTFYYPKSQTLIASYTDARNQAAADLKTATILQKTETDLKKLCTGKPVVCEYTVTEDTINVWLTAAYIRNVKRTALLANRKGDQKALVSIDQHLDTLKVALQSISDNAQIPLMLYDSYGSLIGRHPKN